MFFIILWIAELRLLLAFLISFEVFINLHQLLEALDFYYEDLFIALIQLLQSKLTDVQNCKIF